MAQEHPATNGVHAASNGSANKEIQESSDSAKPELKQVTSHKRELALDLRYYMNRAPVTVRESGLGKQF